MLSARAWLDGAAEPGTWQYSQSDATTNLQAAGSIGLRAYLSSSATGAPISVGFAGLLATTSDGGPPPPPPPTPSPTPTPTQPPPTGGATVQDSFDRTVANGLGAAPVGGTYAVTGPAADFSVGGGTGQIRTDGGTSRAALLPAASSANAGIQVALSPRAVPTGGSLWTYAVVRRQASGAEYRFKVRVDPDGSVSVGISRVGGTTETNLVPETLVAGLSATGAPWLYLHAEAIGASPTQLRVRSWTGTSEPAGWQASTTDATAALQGAGSTGLRTYLGKGVTNGPIGIWIDGLVVAPAGSGPPPPSPGPTPPPPPTTDPNGAVIVGAGDIAACANSASAQTATLLDQIPGTVYTVGDNAYPDGTAADFACFDATWGHFKSRMLPIPGNHEYNTPGAPGYYDYFGSLAGTRGLGYYATDVGTWRVYSLNTECAPGQVDCTQEVSWLTNDLSANPRQCVVAIWHEPRFTSGPHGDATWLSSFYQAIYDAGVEVLLNSHDHDYERLDPMDPAGNLDLPRGVRPFIVGTGGMGPSAFPIIHANSVVRETGTFGVLKLTLRSGSYDWQFVPVAGSTFTDSGSGTCH